MENNLKSSLYNTAVVALLQKCNPIALRRSKTLWSFGHSECSRVKVWLHGEWQLQLYSEIHRKPGLLCFSAVAAILLVYFYNQDKDITKKYHKLCRAQNKLVNW